MTDRALTKEEAAVFLGQSPNTLADRRWRQRVGLRATKIGKSLRFRESDLLRFLERGLEVLPGKRQERR
ncbi:MAG: helix-turn-helix domain-containing protein [candidate division NC10 bacterium]|nr:helix-turn-helix domain-containing protein [candidate division NC10 bacterium]